MQKAIKTLSINILLTMLLNFSNVQNINVTGTVNDSISKQALPNATITIKAISNNNFSVSAITSRPSNLSGDDLKTMLSLLQNGKYLST